MTGAATMKKRTSVDWRKILRRTGACEDAVEWATEFKGVGRSAWASCDRGDWMLWIAARLNVDRKLIVSAACDCAELSLKYVTAGEDRPAKAIATARMWIAGEVEIGEVQNAANAANAAANDAANAAANAAAYAAAYAAANAAANAANAANAAIYAANAANAAAYAASAAACAASARNRMLTDCADCVRAVIGWPVIRRALLEYGRKSTHA